MAGWHRMNTFSSLLQVGVLLLFLLLLLSETSRGKPLDKSPGDKSYQSVRPPVVLSKSALLCFPGLLVQPETSVDRLIAQLCCAATQQQLIQDPTKLHSKYNRFKTSQLFISVIIRIQENKIKIFMQLFDCTSIRLVHIHPICAWWW